MPLFQQSVVKKYISDLNKPALQKAWALFTAHFNNTTIQSNIRNAKEEEYQEGFVRDLFVTAQLQRLEYLKNKEQKQCKSIISQTDKEIDAMMYDYMNN